LSFKGKGWGRLLLSPPWILGVSFPSTISGASVVSSCLKGKGVLSGEGVECAYHPIYEIGVGLDFGLLHFVEKGKSGVLDSCCRFGGRKEKLGAMRFMK
jgi:hypothetical protein